MDKIVWVFLALALGGCVTTGGIPPQYNHPYKGTLYLAYTDRAKVYQICGASAAGCAMKVSKKECLVVINQAYKGTMVFEHEQAHCNGWSRDHTQ